MGEDTLSNEYIIYVYLQFIDNIQYSFLERCHQYNGGQSGNCSDWTFYPPNNCLLLDRCIENEDTSATSGDNFCPPSLTCSEKDVSCVSCNSNNVISRPNVTSKQQCGGKVKYINII